MAVAVTRGSKNGKWSPEDTAEVEAGVVVTSGWPGMGV